MDTHAHDIHAHVHTATVQRKKYALYVNATSHLESDVLRALNLVFISMICGVSVYREVSHLFKMKEKIFIVLRKKKK